MSGWISMACGLAGPDGAVVRASLVGVKGSSPREAGAMMLITPHTIWQTIGGGTLEHQVMCRARDMMNSAQSMTDSARAGWQREVMKSVLGPDMGQCCGGQVRV
ncbi:MAG: xanthine dehydrogenase accessory protein XdhC, partial [Alphaproteobacteria bacterium]|nr:xanthine dehydrogenase accessory protein XdhC [Alphaproteobacteria bacterium]